MKKTCIVIAGPTAVGKTFIAIELAKQVNAEIISADSRQCFHELNIGVAKPDTHQLEEVPHHFINSHSITDNVSAADFEKYALEKAGRLFQQSDLVVMVGGTGLYIKAFCEGFDPIPTIDETIRTAVMNAYAEQGIGWLREQLQEEDPLYNASGEMQNPQRMMRALEVKRSTGNSILAFRSGKKVNRDFDIIKVGLELPRAVLYDQVNRRVDTMVAEGLPEEARALLPFRKLNALQTVGYKEMFSYFDGEISKEKAIDLIRQNSRNYAKRQLTWFKKDTSFVWVPPDIKAVNDHLKKAITK